MRRLRTLQADYNLLSEIPSSFHQLRSLRKAIFAHNRIEHIGSGTFDGLVQLKVLSLEMNRLAVPLDPTLLRSLPSLENLALAGNYLRVLPSTFIGDARLLTFPTVEEGSAAPGAVGGGPDA